MSFLKRIEQVIAWGSYHFNAPREEEYKDYEERELDELKELYPKIKKAIKSKNYKSLIEQPKKDEVEYDEYEAPKIMPASANESLKSIILKSRSKHDKFAAIRKIADEDWLISLLDNADTNSEIKQTILERLADNVDINIKYLEDSEQGDIAFRNLSKLTGSKVKAKLLEHASHNSAKAILLLKDKKLITEFAKKNEVPSELANKFVEIIDDPTIVAKIASASDVTLKYDAAIKAAILIDDKAILQNIVGGPETADLIAVIKHPDLETRASRDAVNAYQAAFLAKDYKAEQIPETQDDDEEDKVEKAFRYHPYSFWFFLNEFNPKLVGELAPRFPNAIRFAPKSVATNALKGDSKFRGDKKEALLSLDDPELYKKHFDVDPREFSRKITDEEFLKKKYLERKEASFLANIKDTAWLLKQYNKATTSGKSFIIKRIAEVEPKTLVERYSKERTKDGRHTIIHYLSKGNHTEELYALRADVPSDEKEFYSDKLANSLTTEKVLSLIKSKSDILNRADGSKVVSLVKNNKEALLKLTTLGLAEEALPYLPINKIPKEFLNSHFSSVFKKIEDKDFVLKKLLEFKSSHHAMNIKDIFEHFVTLHPTQDDYLKLALARVNLSDEAIPYIIEPEALQKVLLESDYGDLVITKIDFKKNKELLHTAATTAKSRKVRLKLTKRTRDSDILKNIALSDRDDEVAGAAATNIKDEAFLEKLLMSKSPSVRSGAYYSLFEAEKFDAIRNFLVNHLVKDNLEIKPKGNKYGSVATKLLLTDMIPHGLTSSDLETLIKQMSGYERDGVVELYLKTWPEKKKAYLDEFIDDEALDIFFKDTKFLGNEDLYLKIINESKLKENVDHALVAIDDPKWITDEAIATKYALAVENGRGLDPHSLHQKVLEKAYTLGNNEAKEAMFDYLEDDALLTEDHRNRKVQRDYRFNRVEHQFGEDIERIPHPVQHDPRSEIFRLLVRFAR